MPFFDNSKEISVEKGQSQWAPTFHCRLSLPPNMKSQCYPYCTTAWPRKMEGVFVFT